MATPRYSTSYRSTRSRIFELKGSRRYQEALAEVDFLLAEGSLTAPLLVDRGDLLARLGRPEEALEQLEEAEALFELSAYGRTVLAGLMAAAGRSLEAADRFRELAMAPELDRASLRRVTRFFLESGEPERAVALLRRLDETGEHTELLADALEAAGQRDEALEVLREASEERRELVGRYAVKALKTESAEVRQEELGNLVSLPACKDDLHVKANLGKACREQGDPARARELLMECVERAPGQTFFVHQLALAHRDLGEYERALELLEALLEKEPGNRYVRSSYYATCRDAGERERARLTTARLQAVEPRLWGAYHRAFSKAGEGKATPREGSKAPYQDGP